MSQGALIVAAILGMFLIYITARGELSTYIRLLV